MFKEVAAEKEDALEKAKKNTQGKKKRANT
jgi:hypothetical protein